MKLILVFLTGILIVSCKPQESGNSLQDLESIQNYQPNPDEVILHLILIESNEAERGWNNKVEVIQQYRSGFGYKIRLKQGDQIMVHSKEKIQDSEFFCAVEYQIGFGSESGTYTFNRFLKK